MNRIILYLIIFWVAVSFAQQPENQAAQTCGTNLEADQLAQLIIIHPSQNRPILQCNQVLTTIAQQRAEQLANNLADPDISANQVLIKGGYRVAKYYPVTGNQVEAVARDFKHAESALKYLNESGKHHDHVMGKGEFFGLQSQLGVGFFAAQEATQHNQWVVLIAEPWQSAKFVYKQQFNMPIKMAKGCEKDWKNSGDEFLIRKCRSMGRTKREKAVEVELKCDATSCEKQ